MVRKTVTFLALLVFATSVSARTWKRVSSFRVEVGTFKNVQFALEIPSAWGGPGDFTRIRIHVPGHKEFVLSDQDGWVKYRSDQWFSPHLQTSENLIASDYVLALDGGRKRTLLFLIGYGYASSPGSLTVLEYSRDGRIHEILRREELGLKDLVDLDGDGISEIVGYPCLSQEWGNGLLTYDPFNVFKLGPSPGLPAALSVSLSKRYNLKHYYGWAGPECSEDIAVVLHPPGGGKPLVMPAKEAERLTSPKP